MAAPQLDQVLQAIQRHLTTRSESSLAAMLELWRDATGRSANLECCLLAHYIADAQEELAEELAWDLRALESAGKVRSGSPELRALGVSLEELWPSLHLNAASACFRSGEADRARRHLQLARRHVGALPRKGLGKMIREGIERLARDLQAPTTGSRPDEGSAG